MLDQKKYNNKIIIEERAKYYAKTNDAMDIFIYHLDLNPKNYSENEIVASDLRQSQFCMKLVEAKVNPKIINYYAKD